MIYQIKKILMPLRITVQLLQLHMEIQLLKMHYQLISIRQMEAKIELVMYQQVIQNLYQLIVMLAFVKFIILTKLKCG